MIKELNIKLGVNEIKFSKDYLLIVTALKLLDPTSNNNQIASKLQGQLFQYFIAIIDYNRYSIVIKRTLAYKDKIVYNSFAYDIMYKLLFH